MNKRPLSWAALLLGILFMSATLVSCGVKDSTIQEEIADAAKATPELATVNSTVKDGVVTLSGEVKDDAKPDASGWNISTNKVFNMVALKASLELFEKTSIQELRNKSQELTAYLEFLLHQLYNINFEIITPAEPERRGAQLSLYFKESGKEIHTKMVESGIIVDYREPGVIRVAPAPLYNSFEDVFRFYEILKNFK